MRQRLLNKPLRQKTSSQITDTRGLVTEIQFNEYLRPMVTTL